MVHCPYPNHTWVKDVGKGNFAKTSLYRDDATGELVAVKFLKRGRQIAETKAYVEREILNHMQLSGELYIVQFKEVFLTPTHLAIAMEYAAGGELFQCIQNVGRFCEDVARYFFQQLIFGVSCLHSKGVCHRDVKLENSLLDKEIPYSAVESLDALIAANPRLKLCDFGYSKSPTDSQPKSLVGTPAYLSPEVLDRSNYDGKQADVWSMGVALYVMLVGAYPFSDPRDPNSVNKTIERIVTVHYNIPHEVPLSLECMDLISRIFVADPCRRITLAQIKQHPWFLRNLTPEMQAGDLRLHHAQPKFSQTRQEIHSLVEAACIEEIARVVRRDREIAEYTEGDLLSEMMLEQRAGSEAGCSYERLEM